MFPKSEITVQKMKTSGVLLKNKKESEKEDHYQKKIDFGSFQWIWHFSGKKNFSPSILAGTQQSSITINIFIELKPGASFCHLWTNTKDTFYHMRYFSKMGPSLKNWPVSQKQKQYLGWDQRESCSSEYSGDMPPWQKRVFNKKGVFMFLYMGVPQFLLPPQKN